MGQFSSKAWNEVHESLGQVTPLPTRRQSSVLTLSSLDPRSPSTEIQRTPIQLEADWPILPTQQADAADDPRSPTRLFQRTPVPPFPIPMEKMPQETELEDSFVNMSEDSAGRAFASGENTAVPKAERKVKASVQKKQTKKQVDASGSAERTPLKNTSRPNTLLRSVQESQHHKQGKPDPWLGAKQGQSPAGKENSLVTA